MYVTLVSTITHEVINMVDLRNQNKPKEQSEKERKLISRLCYKHVNGFCIFTPPDK